MQVTIGGNRLGSGKKMRTELNNYGRSTHNLNQKFQSSLAPGVLYPCYKLVVLPEDKITIHMDADIRTIPTVGPLFGKFKLQVDYFEVPIRLYQALLHNNPIQMGLNMDKVMLPKVSIVNFVYDNDDHKISFNNSCLMKYLGISGLGTMKNTSGDAIRQFQCVPMLAYYDIFKNYYANKQENNAYVITGGTGTSKELVQDTDGENFITRTNTSQTVVFTPRPQFQEYVKYRNTEFLTFNNIPNDWESIRWTYKTIAGTIITQNDMLNMPVILEFNNGSAYQIRTIEQLMNQSTGATIDLTDTDGMALIERENVGGVMQTWKMNNSNYIITAFAIPFAWTVGFEDQMKLQPFELKNIDEMRYNILSEHRLGISYLITDETKYPYKAITEADNEGHTKNKYPLNGLCVKTYQNDIFNNWLNSEWIEGENGIAELTKVQVGQDGTFSMDAINFAKKLYNMLNRIVAGSDGTYQGWLNATYEESFKKSIETPVWLGGMSKYVVFDEIVQNSPTEINGTTQPLGTLGGRGRATENKTGGTINVKIYEPGYIIGIASLTPIITYTQGNDWDMTELDSINDLHKPGMDGIGYQDLIGERLAFFDTELEDGKETPTHRNKIGKLPAWIEYMTAYDKAYGDFATPGEFGGFMVLNRNYEYNEVDGGIKDATTYIDPKKYNYAFADATIEAQNFWCEIYADVKARRLMSARIIPNV